jgi:hypothetical protein
VGMGLSMPSPVRQGLNCMRTTNSIAHQDVVVH